jgi:hypothetical protein
MDCDDSGIMPTIFFAKDRTMRTFNSMSRMSAMALVALMLAQTGHAAAQSVSFADAARPGRPLLGVGSYHLEAGTPTGVEVQNRPSFVAPLIVTVAGASVGVGALFVGLLGTTGDCGGGGSSPRDAAPPSSGTDTTQTGSGSARSCDRSIPAPYIVTAAVAGGIGVLGGVWFVERLIARGSYNREVRQQRAQLRLVPTFGGAALFGQF